MKTAGEPVNAVGTPLDAAAATMAHGASGVWLRAVSRLGLTCRGVVYLLVGYLAIRLALATHGRTGAPASSAGAVQAVVAPAWGRVPLVLLIAGLGAYALSQLVEAVFRPAYATSGIGRWRQRAVSSWGCLLYSAFCLSTARLLVETRPKQTAQSEQRGCGRPQRSCCARASAACCWSWPGSWSWRRASVGTFAFGSWLLALLACGLFCYGLYCLLEVRYRDLTPGR